VIPRSNPVYAAVAAVLIQHGVAFSVQRGRKHPSVRFIHGGRAHRVVMPASPSDRRAADPEED
jgi:hypothetical protein